MCKSAYYLFDVIRRPSPTYSQETLTICHYLRLAVAFIKAIISLRYFKFSLNKLFYKRTFTFISGYPNSTLIIDRMVGVSQLHVHKFHYKLCTAKPILHCGKDTDPRHTIVSIAITTPKNGKP